MKKLISFCLAFIMMFSVLAISIYAEDDAAVIFENIEYLDNGYYVVDTLTEEDVNISARATSTKTGSRSFIIYNEDDEALVTLTLRATFSYNGSSATCTSATASYTIHNDAWKVPTATASRSGNVATGTFTAKHYVLFIATQTINETITITCSKTGVLS